MDEIMRIKPGRATPRVRSVTPKSVRTQPKGLSSSRLNKVEFLRRCLDQHSPQSSAMKPSSSGLKGRAYYRKMGSSFTGFDQQRMMSMIYGTVATGGGEGGGVLLEKIRHSLSEQMLAKATLRTPVYKTQEEYYDEVIALKKKIKELAADNSTLKLKVRRLEENFLKKEKEVEQLLDPTKNNDARRTLADGKADTGSVVHSLKQKVLKLEHQLREREAAYSKLQSDLKTTKIEEMKIQLETYYSELLRLRSEKPLQPNQTSRDQLSVHGSGGRVKELTATILKMSVEKTRLVAENKSLKEDFAKFLESKDAQKAKSEEVNENLTQRQIMSALAKLEQKFEKFELLEGEALGKPNRITEAKDGASAVVEDELTIALKEEVKMQKSEIAKLQQERAYYFGKYQEEELENTKLCNEIAMLQKEIKCMQSKNSDSNQSNNVFTSEKLPVDANGEVPKPRERLSKRRSSVSSVVNAGKELPQKVERFKQKHAATVIQKKWTQHRAAEIEKDEAAELIQGAWKGHRTRQDTNNRLETLLKEGETEERRDNDRHKNEARIREERSRLDPVNRITASLVTENMRDKRNGEIEKNNAKAIDRNAKSRQNNAGEKLEGTQSVRNEEQEVNGRKNITSDDDVVDDDEVELIQATIKGHMCRSKQLKSHISSSQTSQSHKSNGKVLSSSSSAAEKPGTYQSSSTQVPSAMPIPRASASDDEEIEEDLEIGGDEEEDEENIISSRPLSHS